MKFDTKFINVPNLIQNSFSIFVISGKEIVGNSFSISNFFKNFSDSSEISSNNTPHKFET